MANGGQIRFGVGFDVDQSSLNQIKSALKEIQNLTAKDLKLIDGDKAEQELIKIKESANQLQGALQRSFNTDLGTLNISKFNKELHNLDLKKIQADLASAGVVGQKAFKDIATQALTTNMQLKQTNNFLSQIGTTMFNTVKWGIASSVMNSFSGSIQEAFGYIKALDASLTNIRVVTGQSSDEMSKFAVQANEAAAALGRQTKEYTQAALTFYQQGLDDTAVKNRTETVLKASNITGEGTAQMAEYLTAVWNGFKVQVGEEVEIVDKLAAVADTSASDMSELATGMSKVASIASSMGVNVDQLSAQLATIIATTRQAPESVGNALKTIYTRIADIKTGADGAEVSLGNYSKQMAAVGFSVLDSNGNLRDMGEIIEEVGYRWKDLTKEQQTYLARVMAGQRQINNISALFDNWDKYVEELNVSLNAQGSLEQKNAIYMESLAAHLKQLKAAQEGLISSFADGDSFKGVIDGLTIVLKQLSSLVDSIGGGGNALLSLGTIATTVFSKQIGSSLAGLIVNFQNAKHNAIELQAQMEILSQFKGLNIEDANTQTLIKMKEQILNLSNVATAEEQNIANELIKQTNELQNQKIAWDEKLKAATEYYNKVAVSNDEKIIDNTVDLFAIGKDTAKAEEITKVLTDELKQLQNTAQARKDYNQSITESIKALSDSAKASIDAAKATSNVAEAEEKVAEAEKKVEISLNSIPKKVYECEDAYQQLIAVGKVASEEQEKINQVMLKYTEAVKQGNSEDQIKAAQDLFKAYDQAVKKAETSTKKSLEVIKQEMAGTSQVMQQNLEQNSIAWKQFIKNINIKALTTGFTKMLGSIGNITMALSNLSQVPMIWNDENLTQAEKFTQILQNISMNIPMLIGGVTQASAAIKELGVSLTAAKTGMEIAEVGSLGLLESLGAIMATVGPIVAIIAALGVAVFAAYQYFTRFERAVDEANNKLKHQQEILTGLQNSYKDLNSAIDELHNHQKILKELSKGTREWADEVQNVNKQVLDLIKNFPELSSQLTSSNGVLSISDRALNDIAEKKQEAIQKQQASVLLAEGDVYNKKNDLLRHNVEPYTSQLTIKTTEEGIAYAPQDLNNNLDNVINAVKEHGVQVLNNSNELARSLNISTELANKIVDHKDKIIALIDETRSNTIAMQNLNAAAVAQINTDKGKNDDLKDVVNTFQTVKYTNNADKDYFTDIYNKYIESTDNITDEYQKVANAAEAVHLEFLELKGIPIAEVTSDLREWGITLKDGTKYNEAELREDFNRLKALQEATRSYKEDSKLMHQIQQKTQASEKAMNVAINGLQSGVYDLSGLTRDEINQVDAVVAALQKASSKIEGLEFAPGNENTESDKKYNDRQYRDNIQNAETTIGKKSGFRAQQAGLSEDDQYAIIQSYDEIGEAAGEAAEKLRTAANIADNDWANFASTLANIVPTLSQEGGWDNMVETFKEMGYNIPLGSLKDFADEIGATESWAESFRNKLADIHTIMADLTSGTKLNKTETKALAESMESVLSIAGEASVLYPHLADDFKAAFDPELNGTSKQLIALQAINEQIEIMEATSTAIDFTDAVEQLDALIQERGNALQFSSIENKELIKDLDQQIQDQIDIAANKDYELHLKLLADLDTDTDIEGQVRGWMDSIEAVAKEGALATSEAWDDALDALLAHSEQFYEKTGENILKAYEISESGIASIKEEYIGDLNEILQEELRIAGERVEGEIAAEQQTLNAMAATARARASASKEYEAALQKQVNVLREQAANLRVGQELDRQAIDNAQTTVDEKGKAWETEGNNLQKLMGDEAESLTIMVDNAQSASTSEQDAAKQAAETAGQAGDSIATTWSNTAESVQQSAAAIVDALNSISIAQKNAKDGNGATVNFSGGKGGGAKSVRGGSVTTNTSSGGGNNIKKGGGSSLSLDKAKSSTNKVNEANLRLAESLEKQADAAQAALDAQKARTIAEDNLADKLEQAAAKGLSENESKHNAAQTGGGGKGKGGGGKGKGGGGKGKKEKEPKKEKEQELDHMEPFDDEELDSIESKFHDIDQEIQKLTQDLEKLAKLQDRYLGSALVHNLNEQLKVLKKQKAAYKEKLNIAKEELEKQKAKLEAQGVEIGKNGNIKNYTETLKKKQEEVNGLVEKYNGETKEGQENLKGQVDAQKKSYDELKKQMGAYEQLNGQTIPEIEAQIAQIEEMIIELMIEKFNAKIELHIDWQNFLNEYHEFQNDIQKFMNTRATMFVDLATGKISGRNDPWKNAQDLVQTQREAEKNARLLQQQALEKYNDDMKRTKSKKGRKQLEEQAADYGISLLNKQGRKEFQKKLAENYEQTIKDINETKQAVIDKAQQLYEQSVTPTNADEVDLQNQLRERISTINKTAAELREQETKKYADSQKAFKKNKKSSELSKLYNVDLADNKEDRKNFKDTMLKTYQDALSDIEKERKDSLNGAIKQYDDAMTKISDSSKVKVVDVFKTYRDSIDSIAKASDQMINGTLLEDGARAVSILDRLGQHSEELADRIGRMNKNTKFDKQGEKIMGTDQLKVGNINPLTGEKITNKKQLKQIKKEIGKDKTGQVYADMQKKIYEDGQKYAQEYQDKIKDLQTQIEQAFEVYYEAIDKVIEYTDAVIDDYEYINDLYDLQIKMVKLLGDEEGNLSDEEQARLKTLETLQAQQKANRKQQFEYYKEQITLMKNQMNLAIQREGVQSESYNKYYTEYKKLVKDFYQLQIEEIDNLKDEANKALDDIIEKFNKARTNGWGIEELGTRWSSIKDETDSYLDSVEKAFAVQSLRNKYLKAIDETDNIEQQNELRRIMEQQLEVLQEAEYLSEAEVTNAENILEITKKQMALDEAKQNKNKMRLRRDSQGNYTYQFVADQNNIQDKAQELQDALKKMNDDTTKALEENYDKQTELFEDFISRLKDIKESYIEGDLTDAEYSERLDLAYSNFNKNYAIAQSQYGRLGINYKDANTLSLFGLAGNSTNIDSLLKDMGLDSETSEDIKGILESLASESGEFSLLKLLGNTNLADVVDNMVEGSSSVLGGIDGMYNLFETLPGDLLKDYDKTREEAEKTINQLKEEGITNRNAIDETKKEIVTTMSTDFADVERTVDDNIAAVKGLQDDGIKDLDGIWETAKQIRADNTAAMTKAQNSLDAMVRALQAMAEESEYGSASGTVQKNARATFGYKDANGQIVQDTLTLYDFDGSGFKAKNWAKYKDEINSEDRKGKLVIQKVFSNGHVRVGYETRNGKIVTLGEMSADKLVGYDTGGYTGDWSGKDGKLAMLHKKELVLNQDDTSNLLDAVQIAQSITDAVYSLQSAAADNTRFAQGLLTVPTDSNNTVDQNVTIHATFPNVSNHSEIEQALMNLVNVASQKASPNRRVN